MDRQNRDDNTENTRIVSGIDVIREYMHTIVSSGYVDTKSEQDFFRLAAKHGILATEANQILEQFVKESGAIRERILTDQFAVIIDVSIRDRMLDRKEEANLFAWAEHQGLRSDVAEQIITQKCNWAGAGRQSTKTKPFSEFRVKLFGVAFSLLLLGAVLTAFYIRSIPRVEASKTIEGYYTKAMQSLKMNSLLIPVEDSAYHWMLMIERTDPKHESLVEIRAAIRSAYLNKAKVLSTNDPVKAIHYLELAAAIRPDADVEKLLNTIRLVQPRIPDNIKP